MDKLLKEYRCIGCVGNPNSAKSSLILNKLIELKKKYPKFKIYVFGVETCLFEYLQEKNIQIVYNKEDILDMKIKDSLIYIDEFADLFSVHARDKQLDKLKRFFNRIYHLNNWVIISTAQSGFWNKFMNGIVKCFYVKETEYDLLVNGTGLKRKITGLPSNSEYRFECSKNEFYIINDVLTQKDSFSYNAKLDSKTNLINPFEKVNEKKGE